MRKIETELNKIDVSITKARIKSISFDLKDGNKLPDVSITLDLISVGGHVVTSVSLGTETWNTNTKIDKGAFPAEIWLHVRKLVEIVSPYCIRKINSIDKLLTTEVIDE